MAALCCRMHIGSIRALPTGAPTLRPLGFCSHRERQRFQVLLEQGHNWCPGSVASAEVSCIGPIRERGSITERRFVLVDFRYTSDPIGHVRFYEAGIRTICLTRWPMLQRVVAVERPVGWTPPSILTPPEVLAESEMVEAEEELKAL
jgi:hypothetical protein